MDHFIYIMRRQNGWIKVGIAARPLFRRGNVESELKEPVSLVSQHAVQRTDRRRIEQRVHRLLELNREEGDWFSCDVEAAELAIARAVAEEPPQPRRRAVSAEVTARNDANRERYRQAMDALGWSASHLANLLACHRNLPSSWWRDPSAAPGVVIDWLEDLAIYHLAHPPPADWGRWSAEGARDAG